MATPDVEAKVFKRFTAITANFAGEPVTCTPGNNPPDILCTREARRIGIELSEWIDEAQIATEKPQYQREEEFLKVIDSKHETPPTHIGRIIFFEQEGIRLQQRDTQQFRQELYAFINDVDQQMGDL